MKKKLLFALTAAVIVCMALLGASCTQTQIMPPEMGYPLKVTYDFNGGLCADNESMDFYFKENTPALRPGVTDVLGDVVKAGYFISGWTVAYQDESGEVQPTDKIWDFDNDRVTKDMILIANWEENPRVEIVFLDEEGDRIQSLPSSVQSASSGSDELILHEAEADGYTFYQYFLDEECTQPFDHSYDTIKLSYDVNDPNYHRIVYAKMLEGKWFIVRSSGDLNKLSQHQNDDVYLAADIDLTDLLGNKGSWGGVTSYNGRFNGNGHTISNFTYTVTQGSAAGYGIFASLGENAIVEDLKIANADVQITVRTNQSASCGFFAGTIGAGATVRGVTLENCTYKLNRTAGGVNSQVTTDESFFFGSKGEGAAVSYEGMISALV